MPYTDFHRNRTIKCTVKERKSNNCTGPGRPWGFQEDEVPRFQDNRHMKVLRLSALRTGRLYTQAIYLVPIFVRGWVEPRTIEQPAGLCQWKIPMKQSRNEPAASLFVAQCLNQLRRRVPPNVYSTDTNSRTPLTQNKVRFSLRRFLSKWDEKYTKYAQNFTYSLN